MRARYDTLDHQGIIKGYQEKSTGLLAKEFSASKTLILKVLKSHNIPIRPRGGSNQKRNIIIGRRYDTLDHQSIIKGYQKKSTRVLAKEFGVSTGLIIKVLRLHNVPMRPQGGTNQKRNKIIGTRYDTLDHQSIIKGYQKKSTRVLAKEFSVSTGLILKVLRLHNVPIRPRGGPNQKDCIKNNTKFKAKAIHLYFNEKLNLAECGRRLGVTGSYLSILMQKWDLPRRKSDESAHKWQRLDADKIVHLYTKKMQSTANIARLFDVSPAVIVQVLKSKSIKRRTPSQLQELIRENQKIDNLPKVVIVTDSDLSDISIEEKILSMREKQNAKIQDIATTLDISTVDVFSVLRNAGTL